MREILKKILFILARKAVKKFKPTVIGITGSMGKTSAKEAIAEVLSAKFEVRSSHKNYNNEIGLPLTVLGLENEGKNIFAWALQLIFVWFKISFTKKFPKILVLEYAVDRPRDMDYLLKIASPNYAVVTGIGDIPVHVEFFKSIEDVVKEKSKLVAAVPADGGVILNMDDYAVYDMSDKTKARILSYGLEDHADVKISNYGFLKELDSAIGEVPLGINFKISYKGSVVPFRIFHGFGQPQAYAAAAAVSVGIFLGMNLIEISEALKNYSTPKGRMKLITGVKKTLILDDTYNSSPASTRAALETLAALPSKRKIAVLGDMKELGKYMEQAHRSIGDKAADIVDLLFTVGPAAKFISEEVQTRGISQEGKILTREQAFHFQNSVEAAKALQEKIQEGDLILIKGSQSMRMEKAVEELMSEPNKAKELLVRQEKYWKKM